MTELKEILLKYFNYIGNGGIRTILEDVEKAAKKASTDDILEVLSAMLTENMDAFRKAPVGLIAQDIKYLAEMLYNIVVAKVYAEHLFANKD